MAHLYTSTHTSRRAAHVPVSPALAAFLVPTCWDPSGRDGHGAHFMAAPGYIYVKPRVRPIPDPDLDRFPRLAFLLLGYQERAAFLRLCGGFASPPCVPSPAP